MKRSFVMTALMIAVIIIAIAIAILRSSMQSTLPMSYVNKLKELLINGSFTATYNRSFMETIKQVMVISEPRSAMKQCSMVLGQLMMVGSSSTPRKLHACPPTYPFYLR